jgi:hypothetical protein
VSHITKLEKAKVKELTIKLAKWTLLSFLYIKIIKNLGEPGGFYVK